jgi:predicted RNA binding protein YcfA (HicA-like mRNA interferase family)
MKRKEFIRHLESHGCPLKREGGSHSIYWNPATGRREPVPRHAEVADLLAKKICKALEIPPPLIPRSSKIDAKYSIPRT